jgi:hypothetical protein
MGEKRIAYRILVGKPEGTRPLGRPKRRWVNNLWPRVHNIRILSIQATLKRQTLKENIIGSMIGHSLSAYTIREDKDRYAYRYNKYQKLKFKQMKISIHQTGLHTS